MEAHKEATTPVDLLRAIPEASPLSEAAAIEEVLGMQGVYTFTALVYDNMANFDWNLLHSETFLDDSALSPTALP